MHLNVSRRFVGAITAAALLATSASLVAAPVASAAPSSTTGLYGSADPTYDGVYRQSLGLMGLASAGVRPAPAAVTWLLDQQCANGSFQAYRADLTKPCDPVDAKNFTGPDTNSTAMAVMGLMSLLSLPEGKTLSSTLRNKVTAAAISSVGWLFKQQNSDGGWPWTTGGASDANSTGLTLSALLTQAPNEKFPAYIKASRFLGRLSFACQAGGGFAFQPGGAVNASATAQGLVVLAG